MKRLILCCDGTWNTADQAKVEGEDDTKRLCPTNVVKLAYRIAKQDGDVPQIVFYDHGVGTGNVVDRFMGGAFGQGLVDNIYDAYRFLLANYERGDKLYLFGFSRGAFTARSVAGMMRKCGILDRRSVGQYVQALDLYRDPDVHPDHPTAQKFREEHSIDGKDGLSIEFVGVWDTVGALGVPVRQLRWLSGNKHRFHDTELSGSIRHACHALAIDERRKPFEPTMWAYKPKPDQTVEQVWFCGAHSDVGGGYPEGAASDIPLRWMIERAKTAGLVFGESLYKANVLSVKTDESLHNSKTGFYRITPGLDRRIGLMAPKEGGQPEDSAPIDPTQALHPSVLARWDADAKYRPDGLKDYFKRTGDPRA
jgi:uncharacterized protein (DUF2235 family)